MARSRLTVRGAVSYSADSETHKPRDLVRDLRVGEIGEISKDLRNSDRPITASGG